MKKLEEITEQLETLRKLIAQKRFSSDILQKIEKNLAGMIAAADPVNSSKIKTQKTIKEKKKDLETETQETSEEEELETEWHVWSDGACSGNPGKGGWGTIIEGKGKREYLNGFSAQTTNNIMELTAALRGIEKTPVNSHVNVQSDSRYLVQGMTRWLNNWKKKGWLKADGQPVLNAELWRNLDAEAQKRKIKWQWIKGHAGHLENERCDRLARDAITEGRRSN